MAPQLDHSWILEILTDIGAYAELHDQPKVAALMFSARSAVFHVLDGNMEVSGDIREKVEQSFHIILDELSRYCHMHGMTETEVHLLAALDAWSKEQRTKNITGKVITFRPKI